MRLVIIGYSPHYMMYTCRPHLPINFYFPMIRGIRKYQHIDHYVAKLCEQLWEPSKRLRCSPCEWQRDRSSTTIEKLMPFHWNQVTWSWLKLTHTGGGKWRMGGGATIWSGMADCWGHPFLPCEKPLDQMLVSPPPKLTFLHHSYRGDFSLCDHVCKWPGAPSPP